MPEQAVRRPKSRFRAAIFAGPVRSLEQWGALSAEDWAEAAGMMDENPTWDVQHVIQHFIWRRNPPVPAEPPAGVPDVPTRIEPVTDVDRPEVLPALPDSNKRPLELEGPTPKRSRRKPHSLPALAAEVQLLALQAQQVPPEVPQLTAEVRELARQVRQMAAEVHEQVLALAVEPVPKVPVVREQAFVYENELAVEPEHLEVEPEPEPEPAVEAEPLPEFVVAGPLPGTFVLTPVPLWGLRHDDPAPDAWVSKVTAVVEAYGPFPDRVVIIVSIRYSFGRELSNEQYEADIQRCVEAASTLIRHIRSLQGQENRQFLIYPWIRMEISSTSNWFEKPFFRPDNYPRGVPRTSKSNCRLKELEFVLDNLAAGTQVWWLSIGIDALTTDVENLRRARTRWPAPDFTLAVMVHASFLPDVHRFGPEDIDICPPRPAISGMRIRIYSFARLLTGAQDLGDAPARKLLAIWRHINDGKLSGRINYDKSLTVPRNRMAVSPNGPAGHSLWVDRV